MKTARKQVMETACRMVSAFAKYRDRNDDFGYKNKDKIGALYANYEKSSRQFCISLLEQGGFQKIACAPPENLLLLLRNTIDDDLSNGVRKAAYPFWKKAAVGTAAAMLFGAATAFAMPYLNQAQDYWAEVKNNLLIDAGIGSPFLIFCMGNLAKAKTAIRALVEKARRQLLNDAPGFQD